MGQELRSREAKRVRGDDIDGENGMEEDLTASPYLKHGAGAGPRPAKKPRAIAQAVQQAAGTAAAAQPPPAAAQPARPAAPQQQRQNPKNLTRGQLDDMYTSCLKLATENKITTNNSWSLQFIDHLSEFVTPDEAENETNFQRASVTLDAGVKIYCYRVDSVHTETHRILRVVTRGGDKAEEQGAQEEAEGDAEGAGGGEQGAKKRQRKLLKADPSATLERPEALNVKKFDLAFAVDPLFKKTSAQFDAGGARGLLLNNLSVYHGCHVMFDSFERPGEAKTNLPPAGPEFLSLKGELAKQLTELPVTALEGVKLAPGIEEIERLLGPVTPDPRFRQTALDLVQRGQQEALRQAAELPRAPRRTAPPPQPGAPAPAQPLELAEEAPALEEMRMPVEEVPAAAEEREEEEDAAPAPAPIPAPVPVPVPEGDRMEEDAGPVPEAVEDTPAAPVIAPAAEEYDYEGGGGDYEYGGMADSFEDGGADEAVLDQPADEGAEGGTLDVNAGGPAVQGAEDREEAEAAKRREEAIAWLSGQYKAQKVVGGALRTRVQPLRKRAEAPQQAGVLLQADDEEEEKVLGRGKKGPRRAKIPRVGILDYENLPELDESAFLPPPPNSKRSIVLKTQVVVNTLQPKDYNVVVPDLTRLFLRPRGFVTVASDKGGQMGAEAVAAAVGYDLPLGEGMQDDDDDQGGFGEGGDYEGYDYEGGGGVDEYGDLAGGAAHRAAAGEVRDNAETFAPLQLVQAPRKVQAIQVNYARISKQVDVRALKEELWEGLSSRAARRPAHGSREAQAMGVPGAEEGAASVSFRELLEHVPEDTKAGRLEDLSVHLNFICLLHLANERGLYIRGNPQLNDLTVTNLPPEGQAVKGAGTPGGRT